MLSAAGIPTINGLPPSTKCVLQVFSAKKMRSIVMAGTTTPSWPGASCEMVVDLAHPVEVLVLLVHVDFRAKKEVRRLI